MRIKFYHILTLAVALWLTSAAGVQAQSPAAAGSPAATSATKKAPPVDQGKTMKKVLSGISLGTDEQAKVQKIMDDPTMKGAKRRDAVRAVLTPQHQAQFDSLWASAHKKKKH
ncbi:MAG TPA: hypothetical protein VGO93_16960 [Candidatus Xenobia bacterium]|jgi:Spy/CpxP family protein refolding chaperone